MKRVYLDNAATTPISKEIIELMSFLMKEQFANPSSTHFEGRKSKTIVEESRSIIAKILNTYPRNIFFTSGGTESDNMAIQMSIENFLAQHQKRWLQLNLHQLFLIFQSLLLQYYQKTQESEKIQ